MGSTEDALQLTPEEDEQVCIFAHLLANGSVLPMTLKAAIELGLLEIIVRAGAGARLTAAEVVDQMHAKNPQAAAAMVDRILRLLAAYNILRCSVDGDDDTRRYASAPVCKYLTKNEDGVSLATLSLMNQDKVLMGSWYHLKDAVMDGGIPFNKAYGMSAFEYHGTDLRFNKVFNEGMKGHSVIFTKKLLEIYRGFDGVKVLVDVGGGTGGTIQRITTEYPHIKGINFDLPHVIADAPALPGVENVSGDMFESVPSGDAIFMKVETPKFVLLPLKLTLRTYILKLQWILHDWSDDHCTKIMKNCWKALPNNGKVIVVEYIVPTVPEPTPKTQLVCHLDLIMMAHNPGGKERTIKEFENLGKEAGFSEFKPTYIFDIIMDEPQQLTPEEDEEAWMYAHQLASSSALPMTLNAAIELGLLEILVRAGIGASRLTSAEVAAQLSAKNPQVAVAMVDRILRLLAAYNILSCSVDDEATAGSSSRRYAAKPVCRYLTKNKDGVSMAAISLMNHDKVPMESWYYLKDAVMEGGIPFNKAYGMTAFEYHGTDPRFNRVFNEAMNNHSLMFNKKLLEIYRGFDSTKVLVDVGGGTGTTLQMITSEYPHIWGINFDLPHVISDAPALPGVEHVSGDMFESVPSGDSIFMKWILHDWGDEHCVKILKNCWKALPKNGRVMVVEHVLPAVLEPTLKTQLLCNIDLIMLALNPGGKERTLKEFEDLAKEAGFSRFTPAYIFSNAWVIEFTK
ncbi:hypothetical protein Cni_G22013 [Canna indica]|uniref:Caffeic acid O-methyltransferase n=1 Tax=Canna indica TaxID=4628 RepID=A0AAQ3QJ81_9LILI|nr:hypothetical protein Cni_G22013 [Canna indica]